MDWSDVAETVGKAAPLVGGALYGGAGSAVGGLIASVLGVDETPEAVAQAMRDPEAAIKIKQIEQEHEREILSLSLQAETTRLSEINKTMRAELKADGWFKSGWRPGIGWVFGGSLGYLVGVMGYTLLQDPTLVSDSDFMGAVIWLIGTMGAVLGVNVKQRSNDKARQHGYEPPGFMSSIATRVRK